VGQAEDRERELLEKEKKTHNTARFFVENRHISWVLLVTVLYFGVRGYDLRPHAERIQMISWYWHFVDVVWIVVFTVVYVVGR